MVVGPEIDAGEEGTFLGIVKVRAVPAPQALFAFTLTVPLAIKLLL